MSFPNISQKLNPKAPTFVPKNISLEKSGTRYFSADINKVDSKGYNSKILKDFLNSLVNINFSINEKEKNFHLLSQQAIIPEKEDHQQKLQENIYFSHFVLDKEFQYQGYTSAKDSNSIQKANYFGVCTSVKYPGIFAEGYFEEGFLHTGDIVQYHLPTHSFLITFFHKHLEKKTYEFSLEFYKIIYSETNNQLILKNGKDEYIDQETVIYNREEINNITISKNNKFLTFDLNDSSPVPIPSKNRTGILKLKWKDLPEIVLYYYTINRKTLRPSIFARDVSFQNNTIVLPEIFKQIHITSWKDNFTPLDEFNGNYCQKGVLNIEESEKNLFNQDSPLKLNLTGNFTIENNILNGYDLIGFIKNNYEEKEYYNINTIDLKIKSGEVIISYLPDSPEYKSYGITQMIRRIRKYSFLPQCDITFEKNYIFNGKIIDLNPLKIKGVLFFKKESYEEIIDGTFIITSKPLKENETFIQRCEIEDGKHTIFSRKETLRTTKTANYLNGKLVNSELHAENLGFVSSIIDKPSEMSYGKKFHYVASSNVASFEGEHNPYNGLPIQGYLKLKNKDFFCGNFHEGAPSTGVSYYNNQLKYGMIESTYIQNGQYNLYIKKDDSISILNPNFKHLFSFNPLNYINKNPPEIELRGRCLNSILQQSGSLIFKKKGLIINFNGFNINLKNGDITPSNDNKENTYFEIKKFESLKLRELNEFSGFVTYKFDSVNGNLKNFSLEGKGFIQIFNIIRMNNIYIKNGNYDFSQLKFDEITKSIPLNTPKNMIDKISDLIIQNKDNLGKFSLGDIFNIKDNLTNFFSLSLKIKQKYPALKNKGSFEIAKENGKIYIIGSGAFLDNEDSPSILLIVKDIKIDIKTGEIIKIPEIFTLHNYISEDPIALSDEYILSGNIKNLLLQKKSLINKSDEEYKNMEEEHYLPNKTIKNIIGSVDVKDFCKNKMNQNENYVFSSKNNLLIKSDTFEDEKNNIFFSVKNMEIEMETGKIIQSPEQFVIQVKQSDKVHSFDEYTQYHYTISGNLKEFHIRKKI